MSVVYKGGGGPRESDAWGRVRGEEGRGSNRARKSFDPRTENDANLVTSLGVRTFTGSVIRPFPSSVDSAMSPADLQTGVAGRWRGGILLQIKPTAVH